VVGTVVDNLYADFSAIVQILDASSEVSLRSSVEANFRKALLLCAASFFEHKLSTSILDFCHESSKGNTLIPSLIRIKAVNRQYHTWFSWESSNVNQFIGLFGDDFKKFMSGYIKDNNLEVPIKDFMEIGSSRNRLVHQDFGSFTLEKTSSEIYNTYESALLFVDSVPVALRACSAQCLQYEDLPN